MNLRSRLERMAARLLIAAVAIALAVQLFQSIRESRSLFRAARRHAGQPVEATQDRLFGVDYMNSIRAVRAVIPEQATVYFVAPRAVDGSTYFALHQLAPRRLVRIGRLEEGVGRRLERRPPPDVDWVVVIPNRREPLRLEPARFDAKRRRGRNARR